MDVDAANRSIADLKGAIYKSFTNMMNNLIRGHKTSYEHIIEAMSLCDIMNDVIPEGWQLYIDNY
ncbi:MAG: hypothetical protein Nk1A_8970 [Endomicrobiia bacterium]|nr:MAG: hypothetical protein Nk1A_8970 [Endomicrobiia bacterium]